METLTYQPIMPILFHVVYKKKKKKKKTSRGQEALTESCGQRDTYSSISRALTSRDRLLLLLAAALLPMRMWTFLRKHKRLASISFTYRSSFVERDGRVVDALEHIFKCNAPWFTVLVHDHLQGKWKEPHAQEWTKFIPPRVAMHN